MAKTLLSVQKLSAKRSHTFQLRIPRLSLASHSITCVAGPNGSGKSTLLSCIVGLLQPDNGTITVQGKPVTNDLRVTKRTIGYIPDDEEWFIKELTAREYIALLSNVYIDAGVRHNTAEQALKLADELLFTAFNQQLQHLSHGNKKKVQLMAGLMHRPAVIVIDELRNGLDPLAIIAAERIIKSEAERGACILAATHDLWWAERIANNVLLLVGGTVAAKGTTESITKQHGSLEALFMSKAAPPCVTYRISN